MRFSTRSPGAGDSMANHCTRGPVCAIASFFQMDEGTLCRDESPSRATLGLEEPVPTYSYSISGTLGALGSMLITDITQRLPGTLYDRTAQTTQRLSNEAELGESGFGDADFRKLSSRIRQNLNSLASVDVNIHCEVKGKIETFVVRGRNGRSSFSFDLNKAEKAAEGLPEGADVLQPFYDVINKILAAIVYLR
ncbi:hypothetical protein MNBD_GAMMA15-1772 [hydrothermal vent metagenome]|uniref:Uncharacterized protein n=1 Tax=hydrothermal vent metagenome TaxID=652676 RepID=A0A3B0Z046_9ZZZZ